LSLVGEDRNTTTIVGDGTDVVVDISADWVNVTGFGVVANGNHGIRLFLAENCQITGNNISDHVRGVYSWLSNNNTIADNIIMNSATGVYMDSSNHNIITHNTFTDNSVGIYMHYSNWNNLTFNRLSSLSVFYGFDVRGDGIELWYSSNNTIANNSLLDNDIGITLKLSHDNLVANNSIFSNALRGMSLHGSDGNRIFHNNFADNEEHVWDDSHDNQYDDGYPSGGNYWDDYTGLDLKSGPNQDQPGGDGMGDTPYDIQVATGLDRYPLMSPIGPFELPTVTPPEQESILEQAWFWVAVVCTTIAVLALLMIIRRRKVASGHEVDGGHRES
ncbi:MAG: right-handed parallel beta-helix repeat-containing protein, partial [Thermoplasmata archaeon]|nr:right-handed parallel beta-helix repeat-containing protein [Thermoplasmata archaeon]